MVTSRDAPSHWLSDVDLAALRPPAALPATVEVAVIGGGLMGISTAYWLSRSGIPVVVLEARQIAWGATGRNAGLMLAGSNPLEDSELVRTVLQEEHIDAEYSQPGHLALATSDEIWEKIVQEASRRRGTTSPVFALDHSACENLLEMRVNERFLGGRWLPGGGLIHPARFVYGLAIAAQRYGAIVMTQTPAIRVEMAAGRAGVTIITSRGRIDARQVILACQASVGDFAPPFRAVITPVRGQVLSTQSLPMLFKIGLGVDWGTVYWRQTDTGVIVLGGCRDHDPGAEVSGEERVNSRIQAALTHFLSVAFPNFPPIQVNQRWAGIMDNTLDGQPVIGAVPDRPAHWIIAGFGGHGLPIGLGAGNALAEAITTGRTPTRLAPYDPARFVSNECAR